MVAGPIMVLESTESAIRMRIRSLVEKRKQIGAEGIPWPHDAPAIHNNIQQIENELDNLRGILARVQPISPPKHPIEAGIGCRVKVKIEGNGGNTVVFAIVSSFDVGYGEKITGATLLSDESLVGMALSRKGKDEKVKVPSIDGRETIYQILEVMPLYEEK